MSFWQSPARNDKVASGHEPKLQQMAPAPEIIDLLHAPVLNQMRHDEMIKSLHFESSQLHGVRILFLLLS